MGGGFAAVVCQELKKAGEWSEALVEAIRKQLRQPEWSKIVGVKSAHSENTEIYVRNENKETTGVAILAHVTVA